MSKLLLRVGDEVSREILFPAARAVEAGRFYASSPLAQFGTALQVKLLGVLTNPKNFKRLKLAKASAVIVMRISP
jgi:hypothetical protein